MIVSANITFQTNVDAILEKGIARYLASREEGPKEDLKLSTLLVLLERYAKRTYQHQRDLFAKSTDDAEPNRPLKVKSGVVDGARNPSIAQNTKDLIFSVSIPYAMQVRKMPNNSSDLQHVSSRSWRRCSFSMGQNIMLASKDPAQTTTEIRDRNDA